MSSREEARTASGHTAGIHSASSFGLNEQRLKRQREVDLAAFNDKNGRQNEETVYRDKRGKKVDMVSEFAKQQSASLDNKKKLIDEAQYEWGKGSVQKEQLEAAKQDLIDMASAPFSRTVDDPKLEKMRKEAIRDGDPMAQYLSSRKQKQQQSVDGAAAGSRQSGSPGRVRKHPPYEGPLPAPNRFGIRPGYRWDAVDRGNQFERRVMTAMSHRGSLKEDEYKWSVSDL